MDSALSVDGIFFLFGGDSSVVVKIYQMNRWNKDVGYGGLALGAPNGVFDTSLGFCDFAYELSRLTFSLCRWFRQ